MLPYRESQHEKPLIMRGRSYESKGVRSIFPLKFSGFGPTALLIPSWRSRGNQMSKKEIIVRKLETVQEKDFDTLLVFIQSGQQIDSPLDQHGYQSRGIHSRLDDREHQPASDLLPQRRHASSEIGGGYQNPNNRRAERGNCVVDVRRIFNGSFVALTPRFANPWTRRLFGDWETSAIVTKRSGFWFNTGTGRDNSLTGINADRPDLITDFHVSNPSLNQ